MAYFDRFDICEAHATVESDYNVSGWLYERPSNRRRAEATHVQLHRMQFRLAPAFNGFESLSDNGKEIYSELVDRYKLPVDSNEELTAWRDDEANSHRGRPATEFCAKCGGICEYDSDGKRRTQTDLQERI